MIEVANYNYYYRSFMALFVLHFGISFLLRFILTSSTVRKVHDRRIGFNTVLVGGNEQAMAIHAEIEAMKKSPGNRFRRLRECERRGPVAHLGRLAAIGQVERTLRK